MGNWVLGISAYYHDAAAAIVHDGEIIAAVQEERFTRKKHDPRFPVHAINHCLETAFIEATELDAIVFYDNPLLTWDRVMKNCMMAGPTSRDQFKKATASILGQKIWVADHVRNAIGCLGKLDKLLFTEHHMAHAASAFYPSPFERAAIVTLDGVGEWATTTIGIGQSERIELIKEINYPHSVGLLYSAATHFCGFKVNSGEYKLMGLAPYGEPKYYDVIRRNLIDVKPDGSFRLNTRFFGFLDSGAMTNEAFHELFGGPPRKPESTITRREMDIAASVQKVTEEIVISVARHAHQETGAKNLVMAGGVAFNCVANGKLLREGIYDNIWVQPAAGDAGGALGAALLGTHGYFGLPRQRREDGRDAQKGSYLGPEFSSAEIQAFINRHDYPYEQISDPKEHARTVAETIADGKIVGYFSGRMEFGPRALGARSILGDPRREDTQSIMNLKVKFRESFRPFAPSVLVEDISEYFDMDAESPYMLLVAPVKEARRLPSDRESWWTDGSDMLSIINQPRSDIPAVTHVDYSARVQSVYPQDNPDYHRVINHFKKLTGFGVIVNTSFNVRGEPIVCSPKDAYTCFMRTDIDLLVLGDCLLWKNQQPHFEDVDDWKSTYELD